MKFQQWAAIVHDIEANLDQGEGYTLNLTVLNGPEFRDYSWQWLEDPVATHEVIVLSKCDHPPVYVPLSYVSSVELVA